METLNERKKRKVDAERLRRKKINHRLDRLRNTLGLNKDMTRIQILRHAADRLMNTLTTNSPSTEYKSDMVAMVTTDSNEQSRIHVNIDQISDKEKITKASIEQYRRRLERIEYDRIQSFLGCGEKISDIQLLDKLIEIIENIENINLNKNKLNIQYIKSTTSTINTLIKQNINKRKGLQLLNMNSLYSSNIDDDDDDNITQQINELHKFNRNVYTEINDKTIMMMPKYWRPWEK
ncbi:hypothetical protein MN116_002476 [Schistosoma mekongi]|uniref:BHLH domain-containing protein n=1 Tax=Schistosoma mekongi TaxID=38744 RepID=A0AAE2D8M8_SCHME|nr:hypothetical protein MN116_002476 [Schistosoma mekongi]